MASKVNCLPCCHKNNINLLFPDHLPEVTFSVGQGSFSCNKQTTTILVLFIKLYLFEFVIKICTQLKNRCRVKSINHWRCDPMVLWEAWILASILSHVHIITTHYALIYSFNYLGKKIFWIPRIYPITNLPMPSSQSSIVSHCPSLTRFTRQLFFKQVYINIRQLPKAKQMFTLQWSH